MNEPRVTDAYHYPQQVRPGCQHQLGCKCTPPYWLRPSSPAELEREAKIAPRVCYRCGKEHPLVLPCKECPE